MKIGELSARTGCPVPRIRFYEQKGVLPSPVRGPGGQREYGEDAVRRLDFVMTCRSNGMKLECIERFLEFSDNPSLGSQWLLERLDEYLAKVDLLRQDLDRVEVYLKGLRAKFPRELRENKPSFF